jgi:hypothetical protein
MSEEQEVPDRLALALLLDYGYRWADYNGNACARIYDVLGDPLDPKLYYTLCTIVLGSSWGYGAHDSSYRLRFHILLSNNTPESLGLTNEQYQFLKGLPIE